MDGCYALMEYDELPKYLEHWRSLGAVCLRCEYLRCVQISSSLIRVSKDILIICAEASVRHNVFDILCFFIPIALNVLDVCTLASLLSVNWP